MTHTPGPWEFEKQAGDEWYFGGRDGAQILITGADDKFVAVLGARPGIETADDANARLIAVAPELLVALQDALSLLEKWEVKIEGEWGVMRTLAEIEKDGDLSWQITKAREAIAKVEIPSNADSAPQ